MVIVKVIPSYFFYCTQSLGVHVSFRVNHFTNYISLGPRKPYEPINALLGHPKLRGDVADVVNFISIITVN